MAQSGAPEPPHEEDLDEPPPGEVPGYELLERIGQGGMGTVYKAKQVSLDRIVALKILRTGHPRLIHADVDARRIATQMEVARGFVDKQRIVRQNAHTACSVDSSSTPSLHQAGFRLDGEGPLPSQALRGPKIAEPTRTMVEPSSMAISKSWLMPMLRP